MDIVDGQIHLFATMGIEAGLAAMDNLGIQAAIIDEFWGYDPDDDENLMPSYKIAPGVYRAIAPNAEVASIQHPDRFSYVLRIDHRDPDLEAGVRRVRDTPGARAIRTRCPFPEGQKALRDGDYDELFSAAARYSVPIFVIIPNQAPLLRPTIERFSDLTFIIDHIGMPVDEAGYANVLALAEYPNVALKWSHSTQIFNSTQYPFHEVMVQLHRALESYGRERIMWASDFTYPAGGIRWAEMLFSLREATSLSAEDKDWILGKSLRTLLDWPAPITQAQPPNPHGVRPIPMGSIEAGGAQHASDATNVAESTARNVDAR